MNYLSKSLAETKQIASNFINTLSVRERGQVVALYGNLGSGKTTFTQLVGEELGVRENMASPTFVIMKIYEIDFNGFKKFIHIDAYRLEKDSELLHLGWEEITKEPENLIFIEWPENVPNLIPQEAKKVSFEFVDENTRSISIHEEN